MAKYKHTLTASLIALLAAAPSFAQQSQGNQAGGEIQQQATTGAETAQNQQSTDREMPQAATPEGTGTSDLANVDTPPGQIGAQQGEQGRIVMLDVEGFSQSIYERGFRQGYLRGVADARDRFAYEMERMRSERARLSQQERMNNAGGAAQSATSSQQGQAGGTQTARGQNTGSGNVSGASGSEQMAGGSGNDERGTVIVLPPGVTPEMFVEQLMEANEAAMRGQ